MKTSPFNKPHLKELRKNLRNDGTAAEAVLWTLLKNRQLDGWKFRRQYSVDNYVLDFYCPMARLGIELDGQHHYTAAGFEYDEERTGHIAQYNIQIIRFENRDVFEQPEVVLQEIRDHLPPPTPPKSGGELRSC